MAFTMHSHSGQFCPGHAKDSLEDIIQRAIQIGYQTMGLTEHMPRTSLDDLYPEELTPSPTASLAALAPRHASFLETAVALREKYTGKIDLLIGFESEWLRPGEYAPLIRELAADERVDYFVGSLHHVKGIPIDFDKEFYAKAVEACGGSERELWREYYDEQWGMLTSLKPKVVGHFDLVKLLSERPDREVREKWEEVWEKVRRNLRVVRGYGGWLEVNMSALRKGLGEPYPGGEVMKEWLGMGGRVTVSDDSHGVGQVGTCYGRGVEWLGGMGVEEVWTLERVRGEDERVEVREKSVSLGEFEASLRLDG